MSQLITTHLYFSSYNCLHIWLVSQRSPSCFDICYRGPIKLIKSLLICLKLTQGAASQFIHCFTLRPRSL